MSKVKPKISIVIPTLNEETGIREVLQSIPYRELGQPEVLVVDGGSVDGTIEVAKALGATVIPQSKKGYGQAILEGARHARGDIIVLIDGDGVYDPREIPKMLDFMKSQNADMVIGSRYLGVREPGAFSSIRDFGNRLFTLMIDFLLNIEITDFFSGFTALRKELFGKIEGTIIEPAQYSIIASTCRSNGKIVEAPITFYPRLGKSKMSTMRSGFRILSRILKDSVVRLK